MTFLRKNCQILNTKVIINNVINIKQRKKLMNFG